MFEETLTKVILDKFFVIFIGLVGGYFWLALKTIKQDIMRLEEITKHDLNNIGATCQQQKKDIEILESKITCLKVQVGKIETKVKIK